MNHSPTQEQVTRGHRRTAIYISTTLADNEMGQQEGLRWYDEEEEGSCEYVSINNKQQQETWRQPQPTKQVASWGNDDNRVHG